MDRTDAVPVVPAAPGALRALVVEGILQNPVVSVSEPALLARLRDPAADCSFDELGFDSLARMEFCIWMQVEHRIAIGEAVLLDHPSVAALVDHLSRLR